MADPDLYGRLAALDRLLELVAHTFQFFRRDDHRPSIDENPECLGRQPRFFRQLYPGEHLVDPDADALDPLAQAFVAEDGVEVDRLAVVVIERSTQVPGDVPQEVAAFVG